MKKLYDEDTNWKEIYFAGGCFWGVEAYMGEIEGVLETSCGYANGNTKNPTYTEICYMETGHAETVYVKYDCDKISLKELLKYYFRIINPISLNKQGNDVGTQYRTGVYFVNKEDEKIIQEELEKLQKFYDSPIVVENLPLKCYYLAEEYHQDYLQKNPNGYCHVNISSAKDIIIDAEKYPRLSQEELSKKLTDLQIYVTQHSGTEKPFTHEYWDFFGEGIYVDVTSGEPLFSSKDKFKCSCGWASFSKPIAPEVIKYFRDESHGMIRIEVRSRCGNAHLGHVFDDGPRELGGLRYCINGAALEFISVDELEKRGYSYLKKIFE